MPRNSFSAATAQNFKDACVDSDVHGAFTAITEDFEKNCDAQHQYNHSPFIIETLTNLAHDVENNTFIEELLNRVQMEYPDGDELHFTVRDGANQVLNNQDLVEFADGMLAKLPHDPDLDGEDDEFYMGDGSDLRDIDDAGEDRYDGWGGTMDTHGFVRRPF